MRLDVHFPGRLVWRDREFRCALGRSGIKKNKAEGDGTTPVGEFPLRRVLYRAGRVVAPVTELPVSPIAENDGWCDDPLDRAYNRQITRPYSGGSESLWREDHFYDLIVVLGHNDDPVVAGAGSAIFLHLAADDFAPTAGCIAMTAAGLREILAICGRSAVLAVHPV